MMVRMVNALAELARLEDPDDHLALEVDGRRGGGRGGHRARGHGGEAARVDDHAASASAGSTIKGDRRRLILALTNLLGNAVKHGPTGSPIEVLAVREGDVGALHGARPRSRLPGRRHGPPVRQVLPVGRRAAAQGAGERTRPLHRAHGRRAAWRDRGGSERPGKRRRIRHDDPTASRGDRAHDHRGDPDRARLDGRVRGARRTPTTAPTPCARRSTSRSATCACHAGSSAPSG